MHQEKKAYAIFGGMTFWQFVEKREQEIGQDEPPAVRCGYQFLPGFAYVHGLRIIVDADTLSVPVIEAAIGDFLKRVGDVPGGSDFYMGGFRISQSLSKFISR